MQKIFFIGMQLFCIAPMYADELGSSLKTLQSRLDNLSHALHCMSGDGKREANKDALQYTVGDKTITLLVGNMVSEKLIKPLKIDVVVNAANTGITHVGGGGTAGVLGGVMNKREHEQFGQEIQKRYQTSKGVVGGAYIAPLMGDDGNNKLGLWKKLGYRYLINAVGPDCSSKEDINLVGVAYRLSLQEAASVGAASILIPRISSGIFGCDAATINKLAVDAVVDYLVNNPKSSLSHVYLIFYDKSEADQEALKEYQKLLHEKIEK